ncbi:MAG: F0F1 ATP synthase subunit B [Erysipelotrichaceae bacterium]|nr:F0F1 ATP synthase subunit B [Erysipelotrichaceae bacterium]MDD3924663.1 F0F1 ATP synthase subunit B [Erysipelotrichaceae bacterium]MDD4642630.1 F0F1 ATP synthase subunit B [Erysipelotrichaceae bacterium]
MQINIDILEKLLPNVITIITQLIATFILFYFMKKLAWKPVREILRKRSEFEHNKLVEAQRLKAESETLNQQARQEVQKAGIEAKQLIEMGKSEAERIKDEMMNEAKKRSETLLADAKKEIIFEQETARNELQSEIVEVAMLAASKLIDQKLDENEDRKAIERFIKEVSVK